MIEIDWEWISRNADHVLNLTGEHILLSLIPIVVGTALAVPVGVLCARWPSLYPPTLIASIVLFAIPSLVLFIFLLPFTGISRTTAIIPLTIYTISLLLRSVVDGIRNVDPAVRQFATALGYRGLDRILRVDLPIAVPVILGGLRIAAMATIGMVTVASLIGISSLGDLFVDGTQRHFATPIVLGIVLVTALAVIVDLLLVFLQRRLSPWAIRERAS